MKIKQLFLSILVALGSITSVPVHALTNLDFGGYIGASDSPVTGGAVETTYCASNSGYPNYTCTAYYTSVRGFGLIAYTGTMTYGVVVGNGTNRYKGIKTACPVNTAKIDMSSGYKRSDTMTVWDGLYDPSAPGSYPSGGWLYLSTNTHGASSVTSFVCVKTDTD